MQKKDFKNKKGGFTIIETMISVGIFLIVVMVGMESLLNASFVHNKSQDSRSIMDSLNFIMDEMSRNIRTGYDYGCNENTQTNCLDGVTEFSFIPSSSTNNSRVYYIFNDGNLYKSSVDLVDLNSIPLNPDGVTFTNVSGFWVTGVQPGDNLQPFVTIRLVGKINSHGSTTDFSLQTSVSQRQLDNVTQ